VGRRGREYNPGPESRDKNSDKSSTMPDTVVIAGAGQAAAQAIISLRHGGFAGDIVLAGEEPYLPYQRPPLSKKFLAGEMELERLYLRPESFYADNRIDVRLGTRVERIDRSAKTVRMDGRDQPYDRLVLATGSHVRRVPIPGADSPEVHYVRTIDDVLGIQAGFRPGRRMVVVGGGYIGLETAAVAVKAGLDVTVVEIGDRVMARVVAPPISRFYLKAHQDAGVKFCLECGVTEIRRAPGGGVHVICTTGAELPADIIVVGVGILPTTRLAEEAGLKCSNGVIVDEFCRTSDPHIYAAGDCTNHPNSLLGRRLRLESVHNATEQGKTAALSILGRPEAYAQVPWFWSDQYDLKLQMTGMAENYTAMVIRGEPDTRSFSAFYFVGEQLIAVHAINMAREFMLSKKLIAEGARLDTTAVADTTRPFKEIAESAGPGSGGASPGRRGGSARASPHPHRRSGFSRDLPSVLRQRRVRAAGDFLPGSKTSPTREEVPGRTDPWQHGRSRLKPLLRESPYGSEARCRRRSPVNSAGRRGSGTNSSRKPPCRPTKAPVPLSRVGVPRPGIGGSG